MGIAEFIIGPAAGRTRWLRPCCARTRLQIVKCAELSYGGGATLEAWRHQLSHHREIGMTMLRGDDNSNGPGPQTASSASPPAVAEGVEGSKPAAGRTWKQRRTAVGVAALALSLLKLVSWLTTPAHHTAVSLPPGTYLPPAINGGSATVPSLPPGMNPPSNAASDGRAAYLRDDNATRNKVYQALTKCGRLFPTGQGAVPGINCSN